MQRLDDEVDALRSEMVGCKSSSSFPRSIHGRVVPRVFQGVLNLKMKQLLKSTIENEQDKGELRESPSLEVFHDKMFLYSNLWNLM